MTSHDYLRKRAALNATLRETVAEINALDEQWLDQIGALKRGTVVTVLERGVKNKNLRLRILSRSIEGGQVWYHGTSLLEPLEAGVDRGINRFFPAHAIVAPSQPAE